MSSPTLESIKKRLSGLRQYKGKTEAEIAVIAQKKWENSQLIDKFHFCINVEERNFCNALLDRYLSASSIESEADKDTLFHLLHQELICYRIQSYLMIEAAKTNPTIDIRLSEELRKGNEQVLMLKEKLGLTKKNKEEADWKETQKELDKKALQYYAEHAGETYVRCPECNKLFRLLMNMKDLTPAKATFFHGTTLYNAPLFRIYHEKRITIAEMAEIFGVSEFDIEFLYQNLYLKELETKNDYKN